jgi:poly(3-hydroxybutyrate) depolymerase
MLKTIDNLPRQARDKHGKSERKRRCAQEHSSEYGVDPERISVFGGSAGAMTAGSIGWVAGEETPLEIK